MESNSQPRGMCRKLIKFIHAMMMNGTRLPNEVQIEDGSLRNEKGSMGPISRANGYVGSEIKVEFRHINGSESPSRFKQRGGSILAKRKDGVILSNDPTLLQNGLDNKEREIKDHFATPRIDQKIISIQDSDKNNTRDEDIEGRQKKSRFQLTSVASNIDKKSDAFIASRKKAMSLDHESS